MTTWRILAGTALAALMSGCGGGGPSLVPVSGVVTLNNKPLEGATILFAPDASHTTGQPAEDVTGPAGNYKIMTRGRSGLVPGKYKVIVTKSLLVASEIPEAFKDDPYMYELSKQPVAGGKNAAAKKKDTGPDKIEAKFDREITEGGPQDFDVKASASPTETAK